MCTEPLYAIRLKTEFDDKFKRFHKRSPIIVLKAVRDVGKDTSSLNYNRRFYDLLMISCGQCLQCRLQKSRQRAIMCVCENLEHDTSCFITLTFGYYQTYKYYRYEKKLSHYISQKKAHFHEWSLETETFQKFMKRLRFWYYNYQLSQHLISIGRSSLALNRDGSIKNHIRLPRLLRPFLLLGFEPKKIRVMHCGEYGDKKGRPHHHAILFGIDFPDKKEIFEDGKRYFISDILTKLWPFGIHRIGDCSYNSCAYVSRYITKKVNGNNQELYYNGRKPEYVTYSTKPILGFNYFIKNYKEFCNTNELSVCPVGSSVLKCPLPKSYLKKVEKIDRELYEKTVELRTKSCLDNLDKILSSERSIYSKLESNSAICLSILRKLTRSYEKGATNYDEYFKKCKAFGISVKYFASEFCDKMLSYLRGKTYKDHKSHSSNEEILNSYRKFELMRKRLINGSYNLNHSDSRVVSDICFYTNMPNPFKCALRGKITLDKESIDEDYGID